jgi:hypothetical protein
VARRFPGLWPVHAPYQTCGSPPRVLEDGEVRHARKEWGSLSYAAKAACEGAGGRYYLTGWPVLAAV